jgi:hypothetical protein
MNNNSMMLKSRFLPENKNHDWQVEFDHRSEKFGLVSFLVKGLLRPLGTNAWGRLIIFTQDHVRRITFLSLISVAETMQDLKRAECMTLMQHKPPLRRSDYAEFFCYISITQEFLESVRTMMRKRHSLAFSSSDRRRMEPYDAQFLEYFEIRLGVRQPPKIQPTFEDDEFQEFIPQRRVRHPLEPVYFEVCVPFHLELCVPCPPKPFRSPTKPLPPPKKNHYKGR